MNNLRFNCRQSVGFQGAIKLKSPSLKKPTIKTVEKTAKKDFKSLEYFYNHVNPEDKKSPLRVLAVGYRSEKPVVYPKYDSEQLKIADELGIHSSLKALPPERYAELFKGERSDEKIPADGVRLWTEFNDYMSSDKGYTLHFPSKMSDLEQKIVKALKKKKHKFIHLDKPNLSKYKAEEFAKISYDKSKEFTRKFDVNG